MTFQAILWDCDGVLIDSEHIACALGAKLLTEAGYTISTEDYIRRFCGQGKNHIFADIQKDCGTDYRGHMEAIDKRELQREAFRKDLKNIAGITEVLDHINLPMAIASGSEMERLEFTLKLTGLYDRFKDRIYSSSLVAKGKPHPDIFLYAAKQLNVAPEHCLVVEDSLNGVRAGKAAGMTVFGFLGGTHIFDKPAHYRELFALGADEIFENMADLPETMHDYTRSHLQKRSILKN